MSAAKVMPLQPARRLRAPEESRLLFARLGITEKLAGDGAATWDVGSIDKLAELLDPGDLLVLNDSATLPASLRVAEPGEPEIRLMGRDRDDPALWHALVLGQGSWRTPTEERPFPRVWASGETLTFLPLHTAGASRLPGGTRALPPLRATVVAYPHEDNLPKALLRLRFESPSHASILDALMLYGAPIQYAYLDAEAPLYQVQTMVAGKPWSVEMPSAARPLTWALLNRIRARGVGIATLTHGCGISSSGDPRIDRRLPLAEEYEIPVALAEAVARAAGRVIAVGTSVVRALESAAVGQRRLRPGSAWTDLKLSARTKLQIVDGILTGLHEPGESHFSLLEAFRPADFLNAALTVARERALLTHELGDSMLLLRARTLEVVTGADVGLEETERGRDETDTRNELQEKSDGILRR